jgi:hypothetical protein
MSKEFDMTQETGINESEGELHVGVSKRLYLLGEMYRDKPEYLGRVLEAGRLMYELEVIMINEQKSKQA